MGRSIHKLSAREIAGLLKTGERRRYTDGGGLYLQCNGKAAGSWAFVHKQAGKQIVTGLGPVNGVTLADARDLATKCRQAVQRGEDPKTVLGRAEPKSKMPNGKPFEDAARALITSVAPTWKHRKHRAQWYATVLGEVLNADGTVKRKSKRDYCASLRPLSVAVITTEHVINVISPIWHSKPASASQVRGRIERVLSYATAMGWRSGDNPAGWRSHIKNLLPSRYAVAEIEHFEALPSEEIPRFMHTVRADNTVGARALEFAALTATRSAETREMVWEEVDLDKKEWTIPATRMKGKKQHTVPLSPRAIAILKEMRQLGATGWVFSTPRGGGPLSDGTFSAVLDRLGYGKKTTPHGLRSTFRDWAGDKTDFHREVIEFVLAHNIKDETEAAYRRSTALDKRRDLMNQWARYCQQKPRSAEIIPMPRRKHRGRLRAAG